VLAGFLVDVREGEEDGHGVDVLGGAGFELLTEPVLDDLQDVFGAVEFVVLPQAVEANAMCPSRKIRQRLFRALFRVSSYSQSRQPLVSITLPSAKGIKNSPVSSLILTRLSINKVTFSRMSLL
jgi:hypothetical protein